MLVIQDEANVFNGMFYLVAKYDEDDDEYKVTLLSFKQNLSMYSIKRLRRLANVLIDFFL